MVTSPRRRSPSQWTALTLAASVVLFGLLQPVGSGAPGEMVIRQAAFLVLGAAGGAVARRGVDIAAWGAGAAVAWIVGALLANLGSGPAALPLMLLVYAWIPALPVVVLAAIVLGIRRLAGRLVPGGALVRLVVTALAIGAIGWVLILALSRPAYASSFRVAGERDIVINVTGGERTWCRVTSVIETDVDVTVDAVCTDLAFGPQTAVGIPTELAVHLDRPLGDRVVRTGEGGTLRPYPPPVTTIDGSRATMIAQGVLAVEHPGISMENTKVLDVVLDKDPAGRRAWKVNIVLLDGPFASTSPTSIWMWIDAESGVVTIISKS